MTWNSCSASRTKMATWWNKREQLIYLPSHSFLSEEACLDSQTLLWKKNIYSIHHSLFCSCFVTSGFSSSGSQYFWGNLFPLSYSSLFPPDAPILRTYKHLESSRLWKVTLKTSDSSKISSQLLQNSNWERKREKSVWGQFLNPRPFGLWPEY